MTMFAHDITASEEANSIQTLLKNISNGPGDEDTFSNRLATTVIGAYPKLLALPNPMKKWATMLRAELGKIAQEVWDAGKQDESVGGMDARVLEVLSKYCTFNITFAG